MKHSPGRPPQISPSALRRTRLQRRTGLLGSASVVAAAVAMLLNPPSAQAQVAPGVKAFKADPVAVTGTVNISRSATSDVVQVNSPQAIITWRPDDIATSTNVIDILPAGNILGFTGDGTYTVLNRIIPDDPSRAIQFNGGVVSLVGGAVGGNVWFYSPGGIIAGPTSVFAVGGLVLTSSNLTGIGGAGTGMDFLGVSQPGSGVTVLPGAQLLATNYMVMWAPRVVQGGTVISGGNVSYVGAESGTLTVTGGLFDMVIDVGTDDPNGVVHTGTTTGATPADNPSRAFTLATVAKNDFVNLLVGGNVGYADASVATAGNGIIVLSAGDGALARSGNITLGPATLNSSTIAQASGDLIIDLDGIGNNLTIGSATNGADFIGLAGDELTIRATSGASVLAFDNFTAQAAVPGQGGTLSVIVDDAGRNDDASLSGLIVGGNLFLSAFGNGVDNIPVSPIGVSVGPTFGGDGIGGSINIDVSQGGELLVNGNTTLTAGATAGFGSLRSGTATGGGINIGLSGNNSRINLGDMLIDVSGNRSAPGPVTSGTTVTGGTVDLTLASGALTFGNLILRADADADDSLAATGRANGAQGGTVTVNNSARLSGNGLSISAIGLGGGGGAALATSDAGGGGIGGTVSISNLAGGSLDLATLSVDVSGSGGAGGNGSDLVAGGGGGIGTGGSISIANRGTLTGNPVLALAAAGTGGDGGTGGATPNDFDPAANGGAGGAGVGGSVNLVADGAATSVSLASAVLATGTGGTGGVGGAAPFFAPGNGGSGGNAQGGAITVAALNAGSLGITDLTGTVRLDAGGRGGVGGDGGGGPSVFGAPGGNGASSGGTASLLASGGALNIFGNLVAYVNAAGHADLRGGATGADATGGTALVDVASAGALTITGGLWIDASAKAAIGELNAGAGRGGTVDLLMSGTGSSFDIEGQFPIAGFPVGPRQRSLFVDARAYEPQSGNPLLQTLTGGDTFGGEINLAFTGGSSTIASQSQLLAGAGRDNPASAGPPSPNLFPGDATATGGSITVTLANSTHQWGSFDATLETYAPGGDATDGTIRVMLDNATLDAGAGFSFSTTVVGATTNSLSDAIVIDLINGSSLTAGFTALYAEYLHGPSATPVTTGNVRVGLDSSSITSDIFFTSIVPNSTGGPVTGGSIGLLARNGSAIDGNLTMDTFAGGGFALAGGSSRSGDLTYLLDGSTHTGNIGLFAFGEAVGGDGAGGAAGLALGGNQSISILNGSSFAGDIALSSFLGSFYNTEPTGPLGSVRGGSIALRIENSTVDIPVFDVSYEASTDTAAFGFAGADVTAPDFSLTVIGSQVDVGDASIVLDARGGEGGAGAAGGSGLAGDIRITSDAASGLTINDAFFTSIGTGGIGGNGASSGSGGPGGDGTGGTIELVARGDLTLNSLIARARGIGGIGGTGASGGQGGSGGVGTGGTAALDVADGPTITLALGNLALDADATGGSGGIGGSGDSVTPGGLGGTGGAAIGGTSRFRISGEGAMLTLDPSLVTASAIATGGAGGIGGGNDIGGPVGNGGTGGDATGGTLALEAGSGATLTLEGISGSTFILAVGATGGAGGQGGSVDMVSGGSPGAGGNGGRGTGGSPTLRAVGGTIVAPDLRILATGTGGAGGLGGDEGTGVFGASGNGGLGTGGTPLLETLDGSPGVLSLGTVVIDASGIGGGGTVAGSTAGGRITITDASADPAGLITMGSLAVTAGGPGTAPGTPSLTIAGGSGPITVTGAVDANVAGDIAFQFTASGQFAVGGDTILQAGGDIDVTHTGNVGNLASLDLGGTLTATAGGDFSAGPGALIGAGPDVVITAQNIAFTAIRSSRDVVLNAIAGDITGGGDADIVATRTIDLDAVGAISTGNLTTTTGTIDAAAGGSIGLGLARSGLDVLLDAGGRLDAAGIDGRIITADATAMEIGAVGATAQTTLTTSAGDLIVGIMATTGAVSLTSAAAISLTTVNSLAFTANAGGDFTVGQLTTTGASSDVTVEAAGDIGFTGIDSARLVSLTGGSITGGSILAGSNINVTAGSILLGRVTSSAGFIDLESTSGDLTAEELVASLSGITVNSAGAVATGAVTAAGNVNLTSGTNMALGDLSAGAAFALTAGGDLTALDLVAGTFTQAASLSVGGDATITSLTSNNITDITVGGAFAADALLSRGRILAEAGSMEIGTLEQTGTGANSTLISTTGSIAVGTVDSALGFAVTSADALSLGGVSAVGRVDLVSAGDMLLADLSAGAVLTIQAGGNLAAGALASGTTNQTVIVDVAGDADIASLLSSNGLDLDVGGALTGGAFQGAAPTIDAASIEIDSFTSTFLDATAVATTGDALIGEASAALSVRVTALGGDAVVGSSDSGLDTTITARSVRLDSGSVGRALRLNAIAGDIAGTGTVTVATSIDLDATGSIGFGTLAAQGGGFTADAGGGITFDAASATGALTFVAGSAVSGGNLSSPGAVFVTGTRIVLGDVIAGAVTLTSGSDILFDLIRATSPVTLTASSGLISAHVGTGDIESDGSVTLLAQSIAVGDVTSGGSIGATTTVGDAAFGALDAANAITIAAAGTPSFASLTSGTDTSITGAGVTLGAADVGGNLSVTATAGDIALVLDGAGQIRVGGNTSLDASGDILLSHSGNTGGLVSLGSTGNVLAQAGGAITAAAGTILSGNEVVLLAGGAVDLADVRAIPALVIAAGGDVTLGNARVTGPQGASNASGIRIDAGLDPFGGSAYDNLADVLITGTVDSYASIAVNAGGSARFATGSQALTGDAIVVRTGDDIIIDTGALLQSARDAALAIDPANPFDGAGSIDLHAGGLTNLFSTPATPIASLVVDGRLDGGRGAVIARAAAIDGLDGSFAASSLSFDIDNAPASGVAGSDDNGLLTAPCLEGNICLGSIAADNVIDIGQASANDVIALTIEQGTVNARAIRITTRNDIVMGSNGIATTLDASELFSAVSRTGDVDLRDAGIASSQIVIEAAGSLLGSASLTSTGDIGITVGQDVIATEISAGGELTSAAGVGGALEGLFETPGDFLVGQVRAGSGGIDYRAGGDIVLGAFSAPGGLAAFTAGGLAQLDAVDTGADLRVEGSRIVLGEVLANSVSLRSAGDILVDHAETATDFTAIAGLSFTTSLNSIITGGDIVIDAGGPAALGNSSAGGLIDVRGSQIDFASLVAGTTIELSTVAPGITAGGTGDITGGAVQAGEGVSSLVTTAGDITLSGDAGADGDLFLTANGGAITLGGQTSAGGLLSLAAGTTIAAGDLASATGDVVADAARGIAVADITAANDVRLLAVAGGMGFGSLTAGRDASVSAAGEVTGFSFDAGRDGDLQADRDGSGAGDLVLTGLASAVRNLNLLGANVTLADVEVTGVTPAPAGRLSGFVTVNSTSGSVQIGDVTAPGMTIVSEGGNLVAGTLTAFDPVLAFGLPTVIDLSAFGGDITVGALATVGDVTIFNAGGGVTRVLGTTSAGNDVVFSGSGDFLFDGAITAGRDLTGLADDPVAGSVMFGAGITAGRNVRVAAADGTITLLPGSGGPSLAGGNLAFSAREIGLSALEIGGNLGLTASAGSIDATEVARVGGAIAFAASDHVTFGALSAAGGGFAVNAGGTIAFDAAESSDSITMAAGGSIAGGDLEAPGEVTLEAASIAIGNGKAGAFAFASGSDIVFDRLQSGGAINLAASAGTIAANTGAGDIVSGADVTLLAQAIALGDVTSDGSINATATLADAAFGALDAVSAIAITAAGTATTASLASGGSTTMSGGSVSLANGSVGGNLGLRATAGDIAATGAITVGGAIDLEAAGNIGLGTIAAQGGAFTVDAGGGLTFDQATASGALAFVAAGEVAGGNLSSPGSVSVTGSRVLLGDVLAGTVNLSSGSDILFNLIRSNDAVSLTASNGRIGANTGAGDIVTDADVSLVAQSIALGLVDAAGSVTAETTAGDMSFARLEVGSNIALDSAGGIDVSLAEAGGNFTAAAAAAFVTGPDSIITGGDIVINAGGPVTLGNSSAGGLIAVTGSQIDFAALVAGEIVTLLTESSSQTAFGNGNVTGDSLTAGAGASSIASTFGSVTIAGDTTVGGGLSVVADADIALGTVNVLGGNLLASAGGDISIGTGSASGDASLNAGQSISLAGDLDAGGTVALRAQTGAIAARDLVAGAGVSAISAADMALRDVILSGGGASLVSGGDIAVRNVSGADGAGVSVTADGSVDFAGIDSAGPVSLLAETGEIVGGNIASGAGVTVDGEAVTLALIAAAGEVSGIAGSGAFSAGGITSTGGAIDLQGATAVTADSLAAATDLAVTGGAIDLGTGTAGGSVTLASGLGDGIVSGALVAGNAIAIDAGTGGFSGTTLVADGALTVASAAGIAFDSVAAGASVGLSSSGAGDIAATTITAGADVTIATDGSFMADSVTASQSGTGVVDIAAVTGITLNTLVGNTALLAASGGAVRVNVDIDMSGLVDASGQSVFLRSTGNLAALANASSGDIDIETSGDLDMSGAQAVAGDVRLVSSGGNATLANVRARESSPGTGGNVLIEAGENLAVSGEVDAAADLTMRAGERADLRAAAVGRDIVLQAADLAISSAGSLGSLDATETIDISGGGIARIGGEAGSASGFTIDNDEFSRIAASQSIAISASTAIMLDDLDIRVASGTSANGNLRGEGRVDFRAAEGIEVVGEVVMTGATADNALGLETGGNVFLNAATGLLEVNDGSGTFLGAIAVVASNFYALTEQALADVEGASGIAAINDRLARNDGIDNPDGVIRTGTLDITTVSSEVFIQNTAPGRRFGERRGFTVDVLLISDPSGTNQPIVINGIIAGVTGVNAVPLAQISSAFDPGATINGCLIANPAGCIEIPEFLGEGSFPVQDLIEEQLAENTTNPDETIGGGLLDTPLFELREAADGRNDPLIDDPVTGAGNEDLWVGECEGEAAESALCAEPAE
ncbi:hypothetical protein U4960_10405 [Altererythrobacter sp. H2]|uniref:beta strand repeat-containing protein n=1 Tax=Altererythrobacter sp. H2 TaxID=3108391 RepID=UPI002B4BFD93|nr:hypothetical protein [Altererythrobacter sp. H2]WRK94709.1 hypothetical protein U4960_10405 [Altererythrobacter sp. H2]